MTAAARNALLGAAPEREEELAAVRNAPLVTLGQLLGNHLSIGWTGIAHTADLTELLAFGPGSEVIGGIIRNTVLFELMTSVLDLRVQGADQVARFGA